MINIDWITLFTYYHPFGLHSRGDYDWANTIQNGDDAETFIVPVKWKVHWSWDVMVLDPWFRKIEP